MATPYLGEIRMFGGNFAPLGWAFCNGQLVSIAQNQALFAVIGTVYGGDGVTTFALPNLQSRIPLHWGQGLGLSQYDIGEVTGVENVTVLTSQLPLHTHAASGSSTAAGQAGPANGVWAVPVDSTGAAGAGFNPPPGNATLDPSAIGPAGGSQPHENIQPVLAVSFIIALEGIFPSRS